MKTFLCATGLVRGYDIAVGGLVQGAVELLGCGVSFVSGLVLGVGLPRVIPP